MSKRYKQKIVPQNSENFKKRYNYELPSGLIVLFILIFAIALVIHRNDNERKELNAKGITTIGLITLKKLVGSKGTIRCFYKFNVNSKEYEGFDDTNEFKAYQTINIIYLPDDPEINRSERFLKNY